MQGPFPCSGMSFYEYSGQMDEHKIPQGNGKIIFQSKNKNSTSHLCYDVLSKVQSIQGNFENGILNGKAVIEYKNYASMQATFVNGVIHGLTRGFYQPGHFEIIGNYQNGVPHGPFWIANVSQSVLPEGVGQNYQLHYQQSPYSQTIYIMVHFNFGKIIPENIIMYESGSKTGIIGKLSNGFFLENAQEISVNWHADYKCLKVIALPSRDPTKPIKTVKLPVYIEYLPQDQYVMVRPSNFLYFNRVAKTGSTSFISMFLKLGQNLGYSVFAVSNDGIIYDSSDGQLEEIESIFKINQPAVWIRHYAFLDFDSLGFRWKPDWINIVRDPIERVRLSEFKIVIFKVNQYVS